MPLARRPWDPGYRPWEDPASSQRVADLRQSAAIEQLAARHRAAAVPAQAAALGIPGAGDIVPVLPARRPGDISLDTRTAAPADVLARPPVRDIVVGDGNSLPFDMMRNQPGVPASPIAVDTTRGLSGADWLASRDAAVPAGRSYLSTADAANAEDYARIRALQADLDQRYGTDAEIAARAFDPRRARGETAALEEAASLAELSAQRAQPSTTTPGLSRGEEIAVTTDPRRFQTAAVQSVLTGLARLAAVAEMARQSGNKEAIAAADAALAQAQDLAKLELTGLTGRNLGFYGGALGGLSLAVPATGGDTSQ